jgi:hypothetical protein
LLGEINEHSRGPRVEPGRVVNNEVKLLHDALPCDTDEWAGCAARKRRIFRAMGHRRVLRDCEVACPPDVVQVVVRRPRLNFGLARLA